MITIEAFNELMAKIERLRNERSDALAELERLQAENAALREALRLSALDYEDCQNTAKGYLRTMRDAALDMKPDAAPVEPAREIAAGDTVRIVKPGSLNHGRILKIVAIRSGVSHPYDATISDPNVFFSYTRDEIEKL